MCFQQNISRTLVAATNCSAQVRVSSVPGAAAATEPAVGSSYSQLCNPVPSELRNFAIIERVRDEFHIYCPGLTHSGDRERCTLSSRKKSVSGKPPSLESLRGPA